MILLVLPNGALFSFTVNFIFIILALSGIIISQSADFRFDSIDCQQCDGDAKSVIRSSSFWLSESPAIDPASNNRIIIQSGTLSLIKKISGELKKSKETLTEKEIYLLQRLANKK